MYIYIYIHTTHIWKGGGGGNGLPNAAKPVRKRLGQIPEVCF